MTTSDWFFPQNMVTSVSSSFSKRKYLCTIRCGYFWLPQSEISPKKSSEQIDVKTLQSSTWELMSQPKTSCHSFSSFFCFCFVLFCGKVAVYFTKHPPRIPIISCFLWWIDLASHSKISQSEPTATSAALELGWMVGWKANPFPLSPSF